MRRSFDYRLIMGFTGRFSRFLLLFKVRCNFAAILVIVNNGKGLPCKVSFRTPREPGKNVSLLKA